MSAPKLVQFDDGLEIYASSSIEARFLHDKIFRDGSYAGILLPEQAFVIDAGANIGMFTLYIQRTFPGTQVLAFEPVPETAALFRRNMELHGLRDAEVREIALGSAAQRQAPFTYYPAIPGSSTRFPEQIGPSKAALSKIFTERVAERFYRGSEILVPVERLSAFLAQGRPVDLLKVDVEGGELDVVQGIDEAHWPLIQQALLEVQDSDDDRVAIITDLLTRHGMRVSIGPGPRNDTDVPARMVHAVRAPARAVAAGGAL
jgi:FkbM family methyltransferase